MRGEHLKKDENNFKKRGSSPRARGTHRIPGASTLDKRFIPACAGNTSNQMPDLHVVAVHPRVRGEHCQACGIDASRAGSSPRARGTRNKSSEGIMWLRFIPACAGNTAQRSLPTIRSAVHPRVRGEHVGTLPAVFLPAGSSPRARGTRWKSGQRNWSGRFIPACAGNTLLPGLGRVLFAGSSPRARGTPKGPPSDSMSSRFIPACAGNTLSVTNCFQKGNLVSQNLPILIVKERWYLPEQTIQVGGRQTLLACADLARGSGIRSRTRGY